MFTSLHQVMLSANLQHAAVADIFVWPTRQPISLTTGNLQFEIHRMQTGEQILTLYSLHQNNKCSHLHVFKHKGRHI